MKKEYFKVKGERIKVKDGENVKNKLQEANNKKQKKVKAKKANSVDHKS